MPTKCSNRGKDLPARQEEINLGFKVAPTNSTSFGDRYDAIRKEIELARKDLRNKGRARLYKALVDLARLGAERPELRDWDSVCKVIFGKSGDEVNQVLEAWVTTDALAEIGFDEKFCAATKR